MGNESCDLDSTVAALSLAYFLYKTIFHKIVIPIMNVTKENFLLRSENVFVLREAGISLDDLVYRDEIDFETITSKSNISLSLVDHHILAAKDNTLNSFVVQIFDHRPVDLSHKWVENVQIRIEAVGSCCTLIADEILNSDESILDRPLAYLLYQTIVYDTIALKPEYHKATPLDIAVATKLEEKFNFEEDRQILFDKLWNVHNDVSHLTPKQLLLKDLKAVEGVFIPGLPMLAEKYLKLQGSFEALKEFAAERKVTCLLIVGLEASSSVQRDLAIYSNSPEDELRLILLKQLLVKKEEYALEERATDYKEQIILLHINNIQASRKQLVPIVKEAWQLYVIKLNKNT
ncbi:exopolyphosphatase PRUNE1 isoform X2 [Anthonomus grandis grandis]|nr:exopolyphosphatase PRUNE1 isoform X2 [Anthonomus grandis grandis]